MNTDRTASGALRRRFFLFILALSGFVTSFGAHVVAVNLPDFAERVGSAL